MRRSHLCHSVCIDELTWTNLHFTHVNLASFWHGVISPSIFCSVFAQRDGYKKGDMSGAFNAITGNRVLECDRAEERVEQYLIKRIVSTIRARGTL